jgi:dolichyl-diphosphooligosaccharide--protein glycosyltransferase/undecaprenyl-diphosphooligosaccharide--protein glycosyltransferase
MNFLQKSIKEEKNINIAYIILAIIIAYSFSIAVRFIWVDQFQGVEAFKWNDELMINTNDGYYYAEGARDLLNGFHQDGDLSPINSPLSKLTAFFAQYLPFSFETIILYMPSFMGSLLVLPLILIGVALRQPFMGFISALIGAITWSYYNRTMTGYYDTDMLTIVFPTFVLWSLIFLIQRQNKYFLIVPPVLIAFYYYWYPQSYSLNMAMLGMTLGYILVFARTNINFKLLALLPLGILTNLELEYKLLAIFGVYILLLGIEYLRNKRELTVDDKKDSDVVLKTGNEKKKINTLPIILIIATVTIGYLVYSGGFAPIMAQIKGYVIRDSISVSEELNQTVKATAENLKLHFYSVAQTVREAGAIPFETFANRISGDKISFILASIGVILMMLRFKIMLIAVPMIGLGMLALNSGLRFTVYTVPIHALGIAFLIMFIASFLKNNILKYSLALILTVGVLYPNIVHVQNYKVPVVFNRPEVAVLDVLKKMATREDYVVTWWDYGYPIRYYSDVKTLVDGGKHTGNVNYPVSYALMQPEVESANMSRLAVEYTEDGKNSYNIIKRMIQDYRYSSPKQFLLSLEDPELNLPKKTRDIYYYLPYRMLNIFPTVGIFSQIDLLSGRKNVNPFFYASQNFKDNGKIINLGNGITFDKASAMLKIGNRQIPIESFYVTKYDKNNKLKVTNLVSRRGANLSIIYMASYNRIIVADKKSINSTYFKLFVFEQYDQTLFEPVILTPMTKIYKLKK